jgi:hypothetical protein
LKEWLAFLSVVIKSIGTTFGRRYTDENKINFDCTRRSTGYRTGISGSSYAYA